MAKENYVSLRGQVRKEVKIVMDPVTHEPVSAIFSLCTVRRDILDRAGALSPDFDRPIIMTNNPILVRKAQEIKVHDIVEIKGTFTTGRAIRQRICPHCNEINEVNVTFQTIYPTYIGILKTDLTNDRDGLAELAECAEVSNIAKMIGRVCSEEIKTGSTERGEYFAKYRIAVNRKLFHTGSDSYQDHSDYPAVISYGKVAQDDAKTLKQGALIYMDGYIHTMMMKETRVCDHCGETFWFHNQHMIFTPYSTEYLRDFNEDAIEETHPEEDDRYDKDLGDGAGEKEN